MVATETKVCDFGWQAVDFDLPGVDGKRHTSGERARAERPAGDVHLQPLPLCQGGARSHRARLRRAGDARHRRDRHHVERSEQPTPRIRSTTCSGWRARRRFSFPYVLDETQAVAKAYDAQCTPDFFGFNAKLELQYRGRLDASRTSPVPNARRDLFEAMLQVARTGEGPKDQIASIGCSIKWKA